MSLDFQLALNEYKLQRTWNSQDGVSYDANVVVALHEKQSEFNVNMLKYSEGFVVQNGVITRVAGLLSLANKTYQEVYSQLTRNTGLPREVRSDRRDLQGVLDSIPAEIEELLMDGRIKLHICISSKGGEEIISQMIESFIFRIQKKGGIFHMCIGSHSMSSSNNLMHSADAVSAPKNATIMYHQGHRENPNLRLETTERPQRKKIMETEINLLTKRLSTLQGREAAEKLCRTLDDNRPDAVLKASDLDTFVDCHKDMIELYDSYIDNNPQLKVLFNPLSSGTVLDRFWAYSQTQLEIASLVNDVPRAFMQNQSGYPAPDIDGFPKDNQLFIDKCYKKVLKRFEKNQ